MYRARYPRSEWRPKDVLCVRGLYNCTRPTYIHTYIHTYIRTYIHTYTHTYVHTYIHTHIHTHIHTYIHTYTHTYIHTYIQARIQDFLKGGDGHKGGGVTGGDRPCRRKITI